MVEPKDIDKLLPQTQCQECSYQGCMPYAQAISDGSDTIDKCKPGGVETLHALAELMHLDPKPYLQTVLDNTKPETIVRIDHANCIGCTKCIQACPVDAVIGSPKYMHTILNSACTGCDLCVAVCPVDCIHVVDIEPRDAQQKATMADSSRIRYQQRQQRLADQKVQRSDQYQLAKSLLQSLS